MLNIIWLNIINRYRLFSLYFRKYDYSLFLDDERFPPRVYERHGNRKWIFVRSYRDAVLYIRKHGCPSYISFDNDLGFNKPEGRALATWLIDEDLTCKIIPNNFNFCVHSQNPVARDAIVSKLTRYLDFIREERSWKTL
jgi:hypothetical protein